VCCIYTTRKRLVGALPPLPQTSSVRSSLRITSVVELSDLVAARPIIVGIDGLAGSGKTWVASELGTLLGCPVVSLDDFVRHGPAPYPDMLDYDALHVALSRQLPLVVEGVMLRLALGRLSILPSLHVYVRRWVSPRKLGSPEFWEESLEEVIAAENELCRALGIADDEPMLHRELACYHQQFNPYDAADVVFENLFEG
jgi:hypothetical protein